MKPLCQIIRHSIEKNSILPFARFMELALYCPEYGYYEQQKDNVGRQGDFYTSVSTGSLFGELLAFQFANWLEKLRTAGHGLHIVEAGAHDGRLARYVLFWLQSNRPDLFSELEYVLLEPSPRRQHWQRETLKSFSNVRWAANFAASSFEAISPSISGIVFSNELLDAMPVHRYGWEAAANKWFEWGVANHAKNDGQFIWAKIPTAQSELPSVLRNLPPSLLAVLPDGYILETSPAAETWWSHAAARLRHGKLMTFDYGFTADEMVSPERRNGSLRAYHRHHVSGDLLANPGEQDLTAHVNFSAIQSAGENAGLETELFDSQARFLTQVLAATVEQKKLGDWSSARTRQFQTLTHPDHLGRAFRVLLQSR